MAEFTTTWHRFNNVVAQGNANGASNLIGTTEGTASLNQTAGAYITLGTPTIIDNSGTQLNFSDEIPSNAVITNYQVASFVSSSILTPFMDLDIIIKGTDITEIRLVDSGDVLVFNPYGVRFPVNGSSTTRHSATPPGITLSNIDNLEFKYLFDDPDPDGNWIFLSGDFDNSIPYPAVRVIYELPPKLTITTGKLSITGNNKVNIV